MQSTKDPAKEQAGVSIQNNVQGHSDKTTDLESAAASNKHETLADSPPSHLSLAGVANGGCSAPPSSTEQNMLNPLTLDGSTQPNNGAKVQERNNSKGTQDTVDYNDLVFSQSSSCVKFVNSDLGNPTSLRDEAGPVGLGYQSSRTEQLCSQNGLNLSDQVNNAVRKEKEPEETPEIAEGLPATTSQALTPQDATKENDDPSIESFLETSQEKSFSEEPVTDSSCSATVPPEHAFPEKDGQKSSTKRRSKKKRHSKSHSGKLF